MNKGLEFKVGLTLLSALAVLILGIMWLKEISLHTHKRMYLVAFPNTGGLAASDEVQVNGLRKGQVRDMRLSGDHVLVRLELASDVRITSDSRVAIRDVGLMGQKVIAVNVRATGREFSDRDTIQGFYEPGVNEVMGRIGGSVDALGGLVADLSSLTEQLGSNHRLEKTLDEFAATSHELHDLLAENRTALKQTVGNFADASKTAKALTTDREAQLRESLDHFASAAEKMDRLSGRLDSLRATVQTLTSHVNDGDGTLGKLVNDQKLYDDVSSSVSSLRGLIEDIKKNPKKYFKVSVF